MWWWMMGRAVVVTKLTRCGHQVVLVEVVGVGGMMETWVVDVHQGIYRETVVCGGQMVHLAGKRIVAGVENGWCERIFHHALRCEIQAGFTLELMAELLPVQMMMMPVGTHYLDWFDITHFVLQHHVLAFDHLFLFFESILLLEAPSTTQERPVVEHVVRVRIKRPVATLTRLLIIACHLHKALVQTKIVPDGVLPTLLIVPIVREPFHDVLVDTVQRHFLIRRILDSHCDESDVRVRRLDHLLVLMRRGQGVR